jgi:hypothetical protein
VVGKAANAWAADDAANHESGSRSGRLGFVSFACCACRIGAESQLGFSIAFAE